MGTSFKGKLAQEITDWENTGLINAEQAALLHQRFDPSPFKGTLFLKWLGLFAVFMLAMSFLGFIGTILGSISPTFSTLCLMAVSYGVIHFGAKLAADKEQKHPFTGQSLLTVGLVGIYASLVAIYYINGGDRWGGMQAWFMLMTSAVAFFVAYYFHLRWPLLIALLMFFHGFGSMSEYWGHGAYFLDVQDPRAMSVVALLAIVWGHVHENELEVKRFKRCIGFGHLYLIFGLLYLNLSLWLLSIEYDHSLVWISVFTLASIAQIIAGARLKDSRFTGFGIVFLGIDLYTRFYEYFWDELSKAMFFSIAGLVAMALAYVFERQLKHGTAT